jgi:hypothetical protein
VIAKAPDVGAEPTFELAPGTGALDIATGDLDDATRLALAKLWQERADSESAVRTVFHQLADAFAATGAHPEVKFGRAGRHYGAALGGALQRP